VLAGCDENKWALVISSYYSCGKISVMEPTTKYSAVANYVRAAFLKTSHNSRQVLS
jgi:hypothetical protein